MPVTRTEAVAVFALGEVKAVFYSEEEADGFVAENPAYLYAQDLKYYPTKILAADDSKPVTYILGIQE